MILAIDPHLSNVGYNSFISIQTSFIVVRPVRLFSPDSCKLQQQYGTCSKGLTKRESVGVVL